MNSRAKGLVLSMFAILCSLTSCNDDFSRFQFGQKKPMKTQDSGTENMSDETGTGADGGSGGAAAQAE